MLNHLHQPSPQHMQLLWKCLRDCKSDKIWPSKDVFPNQRRKIWLTSSGGKSKIVWRGPGFCRTSVATDVSMDNLRRAITPRYPLKLLLTRSHNTRWCYKAIVSFWARIPLWLYKTCTDAKNTKPIRQLPPPACFKCRHIDILILKLLRWASCIFEHELLSTLLLM